MINYFFKKINLIKFNLPFFCKINQVVKSFNTVNIFFFLRRVKLFVKGKYSRSRQYSKNIIYFGIWFNITTYVFMFVYCYKYFLIVSFLGVVFLLFLFFFKKSNLKLFYFNYLFYFIFFFLKNNFKRII